MEYQHDRHRVHLLVYHLIFCSKYRRAPLEGHVKKRLEQIIHEIIYKHDWQLIELAIQPDHVHLVVRTNPSTLPQIFPGSLKDVPHASCARNLPICEDCLCCGRLSISSRQQATSAAKPLNDIFNNKANTKAVLPPPLPQTRNAHSSPT